MVIFSILFIVIYGLDIATKMAVRNYLPLGAEIKILLIFNLTHIQNSGIAFGLFPGKNFVFIITGILLTGFMVTSAFRSRTKDPFYSNVLAIILGGAWGNLTDRILQGQVTDFLDFFIGKHHWPAFNVADSAICIGAFLLLFQAFRKPQKIT